MDPSKGNDVVAGERRTWRSAWRAAFAIGLLVGIVAGVTVSSSGGRSGGVPSLTPLDYSSDPSLPPLKGLRSDFLHDQLGVPLASPLDSANGATASRPLGPGAAGLIKNYQCVNGHQTDDPLSPPCNTDVVADNGGATYPGVTRDEITVLVTVFGQGGGTLANGPTGSDGPSAQETASIPSSAYFDLAEPPRPGAKEIVSNHALRTLQTYFNQRYQTYGRFVHFIVYYTDSNTYSPQNKKRAALANLRRLRPFAAVDGITFSASAYQEVMARHGVVSFALNEDSSNSDAVLNRYPGYEWGYWPAVERQAESYASYVCTKVKNQPVAMSGNPAWNGGPRKIGMIHTNNGLHLNDLQLLAELVKQHLHDCGVELADEAAFEQNCYAKNAEYEPIYAANIMSRFQREGITTVLWPGCQDGEMGPAAQRLGYQPEWIVAGDTNLNGYPGVSVSGLDTSFSQHAVIVDPNLATPPFRQRRCYTAPRESDPTYSAFDAFTTCNYYDLLRQLFTSIQAAGPNLGPGSLRRGNQQLPPAATTDPLVPTCYYVPGDTTCVKDAQVMYYGPAGAGGPDGAAYCWHLIEGGRRYLPEQWPAGNINAQIRGNEPCNFYAGGGQTRGIQPYLSGDHTDIK